MSDRDALFAAVCANPEEDTPRLVLADWLEEHGEGKRAGSIRAGIAKHRLQNADTTAAYVYQFLFPTDTDLVDPKRIDWSGVAPELAELCAAVDRASPAAGQLKGDRLPRIRGVTFFEIERGFFSILRVEKASAFLANADTITRAAPINTIVFEEMAADEAHEFVNGGHLARFRNLRFEGEIEPEAIRILGNHRDAAGVRGLDLWGVNEGAQQFAALTAGSHWTGLERLEVLDIDDDDDLPPDAAMAALLRRPQFRKLRHLVAFGTGLGDATCRALATAGLTELRFVDIAINSIMEAGAEALIKAKTLPNLRFLDIGSNDFTDGSVVSALIATPKLPRLEVLRLDSVHHRALDPKPFTKASRAPTLRALSFEGGKIGVRGLAALGACPATHGLWYLQLAECELDDKAITALAKSPGFRELTALVVSSNKLTATAAETLAKWPIPLQFLNLDQNTINDAGAKALIASPHLQKIKYLRVSGRGRTRLRKHFGQKVVR